MNEKQIFALAIFSAAYILIVSERVHRLKAALLGFSCILLFHLVAQEEVFSFIDFNTIGLLTGMMLLVGIVKQTGLIQYVAVKSIRASRGHPWRLLVLLTALTAIISAFLDNVTTILLIGPVALSVCDTLELDPRPFIFGEIFASNIGGTATLIGDPPNILIGSAAGLSFNDFLLNLAPAVIIAMVLMYGLLFVLYGKELVPSPRTEEILSNFHSPRHNLDKTLTTRILIVLAFVLGAFTVHHLLGLEAATIALAGATAGLLICPAPVETIIKEVDWITILFFSTLFMLVGTLDHLGVIQLAAANIVRLIGNHPKTLAVSLIWGSGAISAVVDNVPYTAAVIPLVREIASLGGMDAGPLWWALALGACFGGNGTLVGASANLVMAGIAERSGIRISFASFLKLGVMVTFVSLLSSTIYILVRYYLIAG